MGHSESEGRGEPGLRERKKWRTRRAIAAAALRLFEERGYEETTIADIAAAADVSPRTFFSYFPSKEEVVFAEMDDRIADVHDRIAERPPGETPLGTMRRVVLGVLHAMTAEEGAYSAVQIRLMLERPSLQARALQRFSDVEDEVVRLIQDMCPDLDDASAVTIAGTAVGGLRAAITYSRAQGHGPEETRETLDLALGIVERGLASVPALGAAPEETA